MAVAPNHRPGAGIAHGNRHRPGRGLDPQTSCRATTARPVRGDLLRRHIGALLPSQEDDLTAQIMAAFDLS